MKKMILILFIVACFKVLCYFYKIFQYSFYKKLFLRWLRSYIPIACGEMRVRQCIIIHAMYIYIYCTNELLGQAAWWTHSKDVERIERRDEKGGRTSSRWRWCVVHEERRKHTHTHMEGEKREREIMIKWDGVIKMRWHRVRREETCLKDDACMRERVETRMR